MSTVVVNNGSCRLWVVAVEADPTGTLTPEQAPVLAVLAGDPEEGQPGAWYNASTDRTKWRPISSMYELPEELVRWAESACVDEAIAAVKVAGADGNKWPTQGDLARLLLRIKMGVSRTHLLVCTNPAAILDDHTLVASWPSVGDLRFRFSRGAATLEEGETEINVTGLDAPGVAAAILAAFRAASGNAVGAASRVQGGNVYLETVSGGQTLAAANYNFTGTAIAGGAGLMYIGNAGEPPKAAMLGLLEYVEELRKAAVTAHALQYLQGPTDPREMENGFPDLDLGNVVYPPTVGQIVIVGGGEGAFLRRVPPTEDLDRKGFVPLHRLRATKVIESEQAGNLYGYFDSPALHGSRGRRDVKLRFLAKIINPAQSLEAKAVNLGLRLNAGQTYSMGKFVETLHLSEGVAKAQWATSGQESEDSTYPLLLDPAVPMASGAAPGVVGIGETIGVLVEITLHRPDPWGQVDQGSGLGSNVRLVEDLLHRRISWKAWYRNQPSVGVQIPMVQTTGEALVNVYPDGFAAIEQVGLWCMQLSEGAWIPFAALDGNSYVEIEYL